MRKLLCWLLLVWLCRTFSSEGEVIQFLSSLNIPQACSAKVASMNVPVFGNIANREWYVFYAEGLL